VGVEDGKGKGKVENRNGKLKKNKGTHVQIRRDYRMGTSDTSEAPNNLPGSLTTKVSPLGVHCEKQGERNRKGLEGR
jgi:hypothetical protein